jgi:hypothetical protein
MSLNRLQKPPQTRGRAGIYRKTLPYILYVEIAKHNIEFE